MSKYKDFGITLLVFWIFLFLFALYTVIHINNISSPLISSIRDFISKKNDEIKVEKNDEIKVENNILPYVFWNKDDHTMLHLFFLLTFLNFIFSLVHGIYLYSKRKEDSYTKKDEKDILTTTFVGYLFIFIAHLLLFIPIVIKSIGKLNNITLISALTYGILMIVGVILISVGLSQSNESDKKMKELKSASIVAPSLLAITGILYGIVPACCSLLKLSLNDITPNITNSTFNKASKFSKILEESSLKNPLINTTSSNTFINNMKKIKIKMEP